MSKNKVYLSGKIVNIKDNGKVIVTTIKSTRIVRGEMIAEFPNVVWYKKNNEQIKTFNKWDRIYIEGRIATKIKVIDGQKIYYQNIVGEKIKSWANMDDNMINTVEIEGTVQNVYSPNARVSALRVEIKDDDSGFKCFPNLVSYGNAAELVRNQIKVGDKVSVTATIEASGEKTNRANKHPRESIVCKIVSVI